MPIKYHIREDEVVSRNERTAAKKLPDNGEGILIADGSSGQYSDLDYVYKMTDFANEYGIKVNNKVKKILEELEDEDKNDELFDEMGELVYEVMNEISSEMDGWAISWHDDDPGVIMAYPLKDD